MVIQRCDRTGDELGSSAVVGVHFGIVRDIYKFRLSFVEFANQSRDELISRFNSSVRLSPELHLLVSKNLCRCLRFAFVNRPEFLRRLRAAPFLARGEKYHFDQIALLDMPPQGAAEADGFIVGMGTENKNAFHLRWSVYPPIPAPWSAG